MHSHLALDVSLIPESTKDPGLNPLYAAGRFNVDGTKRLLDGYKINADETHQLDANGNKILCQPAALLDKWLRGEPAENRAGIIDQLLANAEEIMPSHLHVMTYDPASEWYIDPTFEAG